jgi:hypothetical protein
MAFANGGLIDNKTVVGTGKREQFGEGAIGKLLKSTGSASDDPGLGEMLQVQPGRRKRLEIQEIDDKRAVARLPVPLTCKLSV